ncbi:histidine kinase [Alkalihalobacillus alcalophilus ATCC 27647 = CGMCC 1.3604]|uniref:histidine kinase n=1 Tax=Alkalihalobacillus alcalophilus ATCC 27647 = CGMCC 1.3604 TaxID=1218173 RepID=A0A094YVI6_ALKAL|nr:sensor histidine kinase [Alkalihalobacillus alcalophilus]KGA97532.1 ATPase [Alkalihalobacillus alcalophilus ATCC 27647 = CGMCC 1.3604]MED1560785.1 sensor histidine kinase [Alkalihalobacillus alcalophilus]THG92427.1 histidine kinase [Alkalihalobacillus alcalophilus ATCC 27647 = CGMCC 1.3604]
MNQHWSLERKFMILICILIAIIMFMVTAVYIYIEREQAHELIGHQALTTAVVVSEIPEVKQVLTIGSNPEEIQPLIENIRVQSGAEFIVIGDVEGIRYTHPEPDKVGQAMVGGDNEGALVYGDSYISLAEGSLGASVRGKTPIYDEYEQIIGVVSVGFMISYVDSIFRQGLMGFVLWLVLIFMVGLVGSILLAKSIRRDTFGLEPYQIARIYKEKGAILESIKEGVIATDQKGCITVLNQSAKEILAISSEAVGQPIKEVMSESEIAHVLASEKATGQYETFYGEKQLLVRYQTIDDDGIYAGKVASFQDRLGIQEIINTLSEVQQYSQDLRAQTHEYTNKLYAISGWLQLGHTKKALSFIHQEIGQQKEYEQVLFEQIQDPTIQAILIGKLSKASEKKITFLLNEESMLNYTWPVETTAAMVTIIGNVLDNAFDAVSEVVEPKVEIFLTDIGHDLIIEVADNGAGITLENIDKVLEQGFTTKEGSHRGFGLALVQAALKDLKGSIEITKNEPKGTIVNLYIPKVRGDSNECLDFRG